MYVYVLHNPVDFQDSDGISISNQKLLRFTYNHNYGNYSWNSIYQQGQVDNFLAMEI